MGCPFNLYEINVDRVHTFILIGTRVKMVPQNKWNESSVIQKNPQALCQQTNEV